MQELRASLVGAQAEVAHSVQDCPAVSVGTMEQSILLLSDCALLPYCPVVSWFICLDVHFLFSPLLIHVLLFPGLLCPFSCGFLVTCVFLVAIWMLFHVFCQSSVYFQSDNYPYLITWLCHCSLWGSLIPLLVSPSGRHGTAVGLCSDMDLQGGLALHFSAKLYRHFLPIWPSSYLYCKDRASGPYQNGYFNHLLFERQIMDFMCLW